MLDFSPRRQNKSNKSWSGFGPLSTEVLACIPGGPETSFCLLATDAANTVTMAPHTRCRHHPPPSFHSSITVKVVLIVSALAFRLWGHGSCPRHQQRRSVEPAGVSGIPAGVHLGWKHLCWRAACLQLSYLRENLWLHFRYIFLDSGNNRDAAW